MESDLPKRTLGRTGMEISALGFGSAIIGDLYTNVDETVAIETVITAVSQGVNFFDTSPLYGHGLAEHRLGSALRHGPTPDVFISSKIGRVANPFLPRDLDTGYFGGLPHSLHFDYSYDGTMRSLEQSLLRLGRDHIDLVLIHDLEPRAHGTELGHHYRTAMEGAIPALTKLRDEGVIRGYGIGVNDADAAEKFARDSDPDAILLAGRYSLLEQPAMNSFLPLMEERNIGVILGGVFNSGILATGATPDSRYDYARAPESVMNRVRALEAVCARHSVMLRQAALQFVFGHPAVSSVVLGSATPDEVLTQIADFQTSIPPDLWAELKHENLLPDEIPVPT